MPAVSPFDVDPQRIELLGAAFTTFVNELLASEAGRASLAGCQLRTDRQDETADGGVDAQLLRTDSTAWVPEGDSAWQFKRGDLTPAKCAEELEGAAWARELLAQGAAYRQVLGKRLTPEKIASRVAALRDKAIELGVLTAAEVNRIEVLDANALGRWSSEFPSIALSPLVGPSVGVIQPYSQWTSSNRHQTVWTADDSRSRLLEAIRESITSGDSMDLRVIGPSGIGKSRLVMEAARDQEFTPIVAYVPSADDVDSSSLSALVRSESSVVLIVDECSARRHEKLAEQLPVDSSIRLITIGIGDDQLDYPIKSPVWQLEGMSEEALEQFLESNHAELWTEARRLVVQYAAGNVRLADLLAVRVGWSDATAVAEMISKGDVNELLALTLPEGDYFLVARSLALFERVGFDEELAPELDAVARFAGVTADDVRRVAQRLHSDGVLETQGRYRAVAPEPFAVYLAASGWRNEGERILLELFPSISSPMQTALLRRAAELGRYEPASDVLARLLGDDAILGSLSRIEEHGASELLIHLAVVAPEATTRRLSTMIDSESREALRAMTRSRRDLVWTLEKLAWHTNTFERAANALLRLALAENETYANNATGVWVSLFGALLPATAATPESRLRYLTRVAQSELPEVRALSVQACQTGLQFHEFVTVSGERQGGSLVEPRGMPATWQDAANYRIGEIEILRGLIDDNYPAVAQPALEALLGTVHPLADDPLVGPRLNEILLSLAPSDLLRLREEVERLLWMRRTVLEGAAEEQGPRDQERIIAALQALLEQLPPPSDMERLRLIASRSPWDLERDGSARAELSELVRRVTDAEGVEALIDWLMTSEVASSWFVGYELRNARLDERNVLAALTEKLPDSLLALSGYLVAQVDASNSSALDDFLDAPQPDGIDGSTKLALTVRGPQSDAALARVLNLVPSLPVTSTARALTSWASRLPEPAATEILREWTARIDEQESYNAVIDWCALWLHGRSEVSELMQGLFLQLISFRRLYPSLGNARWDWARVAEQVPAPDVVAEVVLNLISDGQLTLIGGEEEAVLLARAASSDPDGVWALVSERLESNDWRIATMLRGWFLPAVPAPTIESWIGNSLERARQAASIAPAGDQEPSPYAAILLTKFPDDDEIASDLAADFSSGAWVGPWSDRIRTQISDLERWVSRKSYSAGVRRWAERMIENLQIELQWTLRREAEERP
jgi:hypothetical protein